MTSPAEAIARRLVVELGAGAHDAVDLALGQLTALERAALWFNWDEFWARPKQIPPPTAWRSWGLMTGRGFGKTDSLAHYIVGETMAGRAGRIGLCAQTEDDTRGIMIEGETGLIAASPPWFPARYEPTNGVIFWPNGAKAHVFTAEKPDGFRGYQFHRFWADEVGAWPEATADACWYNLRMALRLGDSRLVWSSTPRTTRLIALLLERAKASPERHIIVRGSTFENRANLPPEFIADMVSEYGGTRLGQQELEGEYLEDEIGALFSTRVIEINRVTSPPALVRVVISVDPAITARRGSDETGIIVAGVDEAGHMYILEDLSGKLSPEQWARITVSAHARHGADCVVAELNRGGNMVTHTLRAADPEHRIRIVEVHAKEHKRARAEPIAAAYERGRVHHVRGAQLAELEKQMTSWDPRGSTSPDRVDALVQAGYELGGITGKGPVQEYTSARVPSRMAALDRGRDRDLVDEAPDDDELEDRAPLASSRW